MCVLWLLILLLNRTFSQGFALWLCERSTWRVVYSFFRDRAESANHTVCPSVPYSPAVLVILHLHALIFCLVFFLTHVPAASRKDFAKAGKQVSDCRAACEELLPLIKETPSLRQGSYSNSMEVRRGGEEGGKRDAVSGWGGGGERGGL